MSGRGSEATELVYDAARERFVATRGMVNELGEFAASVVRFNVLVLGILATGLSFLWRPAAGPGARVPLWILVPFGLGLACLAGSTLYAVRSFLQPEVVVGVDTTEFEDAFGTDVEPVAVRNELVRAYNEAGDDNGLVLERVSARFQRSLWLLSASILLLTGGALGLLLLGG